MALTGPLLIGPDRHGFRVAVVDGKIAASPAEGARVLRVGGEPCYTAHGLVGPRVLGYLSESKVKAAKIQIESFSAALDLFYLDTGRYPAGNEGLAARHLRFRQGACPLA